MYDDYYKQFLDIFKDLSIKHDKYQIFFDFMKIVSLSIQNSFLKSADIENDFKQTVKKYSEQEIQSFQKLFVILVMMFE